MSDPIKNQVALLPEPPEMTPMQMLQIAVSKGVDTEQIKQLMDLEREWKAGKAREAFVHAMNAFRAESLEVVKRKHVSFDTTSYHHATLADVVAVAAPKLSKHGLSHRWETKQEGSMITVRCIILHELGHSEYAELSAPPDNSGKKNTIQSIGSTVTYLQRYTFTSITGLAAKDQDDDGQGSTDAELIAADQVTVIEDKIVETKTNRAVFLRWLKVESLDQLRTKDYQRALDQLDKLAAGRK
jgi:hypothetical protein